MIVIKNMYNLVKAFFGGDVETDPPKQSQRPFYELWNKQTITPTQRLAGRKKQVPVTYQGKTQKISAWSRELGIPDSSIRSRLKRGLTVEEAMNPHPRVKVSEPPIPSESHEPRITFLEKPPRRTPEQYHAGTVGSVGGPFT